MIPIYSTTVLYYTSKYKICQPPTHKNYLLQSLLLFPHTKFVGLIFLVEIIIQTNCIQYSITCRLNIFSLIEYYQVEPLDSLAIVKSPSRQLRSRHTVVCRSAQENGACKQSEYIDRNNKVSIFTHLQLRDGLSKWHQIYSVVSLHKGQAHVSNFNKIP